MSTITFTRIDAKGPGASGLNPALHDPADVILEGAKAPHALNAFSDASNMLSAGVWQCDAGTLKLADLPIHEVCVLIEGEVVITSDDGCSERYAAGDAFILHKGFSGTWHMPVATKKYSIVYCG
ncbi:cupin domain-containing protein [Paraburkholderia nemoris]|uniref:cupin domain-containing protein n=1 Tax=Paraburkholderia nemoris TaxID=2793076 RepID=UPI0038BC745F